jgi:hypothetical protein
MRLAASDAVTRRLPRSRKPVNRVKKITLYNFPFILYGEIISELAVNGFASAAEGTEAPRVDLHHVFSDPQRIGRTEHKQKPTLITANQIVSVVMHEFLALP